MFGAVTLRLVMIMSVMPLNFRSYLYMLNIVV